MFESGLTGRGKRTGGSTPWLKGQSAQTHARRKPTAWHIAAAAVVRLRTHSSFTSLHLLEGRSHDAPSWLRHESRFSLLSHLFSVSRYVYVKKRLKCNTDAFLQKPRLRELQPRFNAPPAVVYGLR